MSEEIKNILDKFDKILKNYELDKKCGQISTDSICHLFPSEIITIKDYIQQKDNIIKEVREYIENKEFINYKKNLGNFERMLKHRQDISKILDKVD